MRVDGYSTNLYGDFSPCSTKIRLMSFPSVLHGKKITAWDKITFFNGVTCVTLRGYHLIIWQPVQFKEKLILYH